MELARKSRGGERDRISSLSDSLIHLIMSFLTAQEAVRTCIFSKRWKNLWTTLPFLDFDLLKFKYRSDPRSNQLEKFRDFVCMTLLRREASDLHKFRLVCLGVPRPEYVMFVTSWILYALKHNPQVIVLNVNFILEGSLHLGVFTCASLVDVSLYHIKSVHNIEVINLPCLRRLHLMRIDLNQDFVDKLFSGCPVLEFLHLRSCFSEYCTINSQSLKYLTVENYNSGHAVKEMELFNTPNLLSFCYTNDGDHSFGLKLPLTMPSLTCATLNISCRWLDWSYNGQNNILIGLSNVQNLTLSGYKIQDILESELPNCAEFANLKDLLVNGVCLSCHFNLLASFLNHCPNLERLSLNCANCYCKEAVDINQESLKIAPFKGKQLQTVEVKFYRHDENFLRVMKYLLDITKDSSAQINMTSLDNWPY